MNENVMLHTKKDHPGIYVPPPIIYAVVFVTGIAKKVFT